MITTHGTKRYLYLGVGLLLFPISAFLVYSSTLSSSSRPDLPSTPEKGETPVKVNFIKAHELKDWLDNGAPFLLVDARRPEEYANGHIPTAVSVDRHPLSKRGRNQGKRQVPVIFYCNGPVWGQADPCVRAIARAFQSGSNQVYWFKEGIRAWRAQGYSVMTSSQEGEPDR
ncbi:MAG: rhodanese-like domain-containing protein [Candidatus Methylomirabilales bacterium]